VCEEAGVCKEAGVCAAPPAVASVKRALQLLFDEAGPLMRGVMRSVMRGP